MNTIAGSSNGYGIFTGGGCGHLEGFHLGEEINKMMSGAMVPDNGSSFTALLGLQPTEALELLHEPNPGRSALPPSADRGPRGLAFSCLPTFSAVAPGIAESPENSSNPSASGKILNQIKSEAVDSDPAFIFPPQDCRPATNNKRKEFPAEKQKVRTCGKKSKSTQDAGEPAEKLPYVHVRVRRGQATDSHSLAERARREKINARMKFLQELVPGCNKISGTALMLDEIINHVQSLQRQVEILSMRLASVNPGTDLHLYRCFSSDYGALTLPSATTVELGSVWPEMLQASVGPRWPNHQTQQQCSLRHLGPCLADPRVFVGDPESTTPTSILGYDSVNSECRPTAYPLSLCSKRRSVLLERTDVTGRNRTAQ